MSGATSANIAQAVARAMLAIGAVSFVPDAPVTFKSGIVSPVYCDGRKLPFAPEGVAHRHSRVREVDRGRRASEFDVLGGIETAGIPHSAALSYAMNVPSIFIRKAAKEHGLKRRVEGGDVTGKRVLLVEDVVTTGGIEPERRRGFAERGRRGARLSGDSALRLRKCDGAVCGDGCAVAYADDV